MSAPSLRDYQEAALRNLAQQMERRPCLVAPTGSGKTVMGAEFVRRLDVPTLWLAHRTELIAQAAGQLRALGLRVGVIQADAQADEAASVQVASVATLVRRAAPVARLVVIDEAHHATAAQYGAILDQYPDAWVLGLTATPYRLDGAGLGDIFGRLVVAATTAELVERGYLHAPKVYAPSVPDLRGVRTERGDYAPDALAEKLNRRELVGDLVATWHKLAEGLPTVAYGINREHSRAIAEAFTASGVPAVHLDGQTPANERREALAALACGRVRVVSNCMILTEGVDVPALACGIIARPTASLGLHHQIVGRIMRLCPGKTGAVILDHAGNHLAHGLCTRAICYTLDPARHVGCDEPLGLVRCEGCGLLFDNALEACPECAWQPTPAARRGAVLSAEGELIEFVEGYAVRAALWKLYEAQRQAAGFPELWARRRYRERFGAWPVVVGGELVDTEHATGEQKRAVFAELVAIAEVKGYAPGWASQRYRATFGVWPKGFVRAVRGPSLARRYSTKLAKQ